MVKGVSKTVIVVNNTGSKLFEKIVFYVTPEYGNLSAKQLKKAASAFSFNYDFNPPKNGSLRASYVRKRKIRIIAFSLAIVALLAVALVLIL
ncbi:MAG: hypothetical protein IKD04_07350 [Clostridia bacterium]|nr:hypothetical protein [Clostridia bacterium]